VQHHLDDHEEEEEDVVACLQQQQQLLLHCHCHDWQLMLVVLVRHDVLLLVQIDSFLDEEERGILLRMLHVVVVAEMRNDDDTANVDVMPLQLLQLVVVVVVVVLPFHVSCLQ